MQKNITNKQTKEEEKKHGSCVKNNKTLFKKTLIYVCTQVGEEDNKQGSEEDDERDGDGEKNKTKNNQK